MSFLCRSATVVLPHNFVNVCPMNTRKCVRIFLLPVLLFLGSCIREKCQEEITPRFNRPLLLNISAKARSSSGHAGDIADRAISVMRVLIYDSKSGNLVFNHFIPEVSDTIPLYISKGKYDFAFIANENSDKRLADELAALTPGVDRKSDLQKMWFSASAFSRDKDIPMVTIVEDVAAIDDECYQTSTMPSALTGVWVVWMERLGIRLDMTLRLNPAQYSEFIGGCKMHFSNVPDRVYLVSGIPNYKRALALERVISIGPDDMVCLLDPENEHPCEITARRIILPESVFAEKTNAANALMLTIGLGVDDTVSAKISLDPGVDYTMPRNCYLNVSGCVKTSDFTIDATIMNWTEHVLERIL